jgi:predicted regulator of Ras-like GTPase activity (Roadblock/LC7/MglB family)
VDAARALADLTEISSQIEAAVMIEADGTVLASTFGDESRARRLANAARDLLAAAERVRGEAAGPLAQLEAATGDGSVFVVRDSGRREAEADRERTGPRAGASGRGWGRCRVREAS